MFRRRSIRFRRVLRCTTSLMCSCTVLRPAWCTSDIHRDTTERWSLLVAWLCMGRAITTRHMLPEPTGCRRRIHMELARDLAGAPLPDGGWPSVWEWRWERTAVHGGARSGTGDGDTQLRHGAGEDTAALLLRMFMDAGAIRLIRERARRGRIRTREISEAVGVVRTTTL